jgi:type I restriction enzyme M protein
MSNTSTPISQDEINNILWKACDILRGTADPSEYRDYILTILFVKYISDLKKDYDEGYKKQNFGKIPFTIPQGCSFEELYAKSDAPYFGEVVNSALRKIEDVNRERLEGVFTNIDFTFGGNRGDARESTEQLRQLFRYFNDSRLDLRPSRMGETKIIGSIYSHLLDKFARQDGFRGGESYTPQNLLPIMANILQPKAGKSLYDPAVGTGGMLIASSQYVREHEGEDQQLAMFGQDISQDSISSSKMNLFFHQIFDASILLGDTLRNPKFIHNKKLQKFDYILSSPPITSKIRQETLWEIERDDFGRFTFGIPNRSSDFIFLQHIIASLNDNGKAVVIVPSGVLFRTGIEGEIRKKLIENDLVESIIAFGPGLLSNTSIPINLLIINKAKLAERKNKILLINATEEYERINRAGSFINQEQQVKIIRAYNNFKPIESFAAVVSFDELNSNEFNLMPTRYVRLFPINNFLGGKVTWERFSNLAEIIQSNTPVVESESDNSELPIIRLSNFSNQRLVVGDLGRISLPVARERVQYVQTGDILLSRVGSIKTFLVDETINGAVIDRNLYIIRLKSEFQHLSRYIVEFLRSDKGYNLLSKYFIGATAPQLRLVDLRNVEIPIPAESVIHLITNIYKVENELIQRVEKTQSLRTKLFNITDPEEVQKQLDELGTDAQILSSSLIQADSLDYQVRNFYPFPLAYAYRTLSAIYDPVQKYPEQLRVAENILVFLAVTGLTLMQSCETLKNQTDITNSTVNKFFGGGISPGDWQSLAYFAGRSIRGQRRYAVGDSFASLWFKGAGTKESDFAKTTKTLVELKNDFKHDRGPKTPHEFALASKELQDHLDTCYTQLSFFVKYPIRSVQSINIDWQTNKAILETLVYEGDHPGLRQERVEHSKPLTKDMLYLELDKDLWSPLYPHVSVQYCQSCKTRETYFIDRWDGQGGKITLKSFERGHTHESDADAKQVATDMEHWIANNLNN